MVYSSPQNGSKSLHTVAVLTEKTFATEFGCNLFSRVSHFPALLEREKGWKVRDPGNEIDLGAFYLQSVLPFFPIAIDQSQIAENVMMSTCRHQYTSRCLETPPLELADPIKLQEPSHDLRTLKHVV